MLVTTPTQLRELVREYKRRDAFVFDLETTYTPTAWEAERLVTLRSKSPGRRTPDEKAWLEAFDMSATDELRNEVIWFGMATLGRSDAIACGHPHGEMVKPARQEKVKVVELFPEGDPRRYTKGGKESRRHVPRMLPAEFAPAPPQCDLGDVIDALEPLLMSERRKVNQNLRFDARSLCKYYGGRLVAPLWGELQVALHILDENRFTSWDLETFVSKRLGHRYSKLGKLGVTNFAFSAAARYAEQDARFTWLLWTEAERRLRSDPVLWRLFEFEMDVARALRPQEIHGVKIDRAKMTELRRRYETRLTSIRDRLIVDYGAPRDFNPNANAQKGALLYDQLKAHTIVKTEGTGAKSVAASVLKAIVAEGGKAGGAASLLLEHAECAKLLGTYLIGIGAKLTDNDYLHPSFNQHTTRTGRLSCYAPSVHNIARDSDVRGMFVADRGEVLISVDYDQIELRFICTYAEEETMQALFLSEDDIHTATAALITGKDSDEITIEERTVAGKMPNFLIGYGGGAYRLHLATGIPIERAEKIIDAYYKRFRRLAPWKLRELSAARARAVWGERDGRRRLLMPPYVETMLGRRRRLPDLFINPRAAGDDKEEWKRLNGRLRGAERQAINAIIQGSAADTLKLAMIDINDHVHREGFPLSVIMNVHDELVAVCPEDCGEEALKMMVDKMENVTNPLTGEPPLGGWVPLIASGKLGERWQKA